MRRGKILQSKIGRKTKIRSTNSSQMKSNEEQR